MSGQLDNQSPEIKQVPEIKPVDAKEARYVNMGGSNFISSMRTELKKLLMRADILPGERSGNEYTIDKDILMACGRGYSHESLPAPKEMEMNHTDDDSKIEEVSALKEEVAVLRHNLKLARDLLRGAGRAIASEREARFTAEIARDDKVKEIAAIKTDVVDVLSNGGRKIIERAVMKVLPPQTNGSNHTPRY